MIRVGMIKYKLDTIMRQWQAKHDRDLTLQDIHEHTKNVAPPGLSMNFLSRFKNGQVRKLDLEKTALLCAVLGVSLDDLLWEDNGDNDLLLMPAVNTS